MDEWTSMDEWSRRLSPSGTFVQDGVTDPKWFELICVDGKVAMSESDLEMLLKGSNVLKYMVWGGGGYKELEKPNLDVFKSYGMKREILVTILHCIKSGGYLPYHWRHKTRNDTCLVNLFDQANFLGGFRDVDQAIEYHFRHTIED